MPAADRRSEDLWACGPAPRCVRVLSRASIAASRSLAALAVGVAVLAAAFLPIAATAQTEQAGGGWWTGPALERGHWAAEALRRVDALGLLEDYLPAQRAIPLEVVERALRAGRDAASREMPELRPLIEAWHSRLLAEYPALDTLDSGARDIRLLGFHAGAGYVHRNDGVSPGMGEFEPDRTGAIPLPDRSRPLAVQEVAASLGEHVALSTGTALDADGVFVNELELAGGAGWFRASIGRSPVGYAYGFGGGVVLTGDAALDAVQLGTRTPVRLPGFLRHAGPVAFHTFLGRMWEERHPDEPFIWGASGQFRPHRRFTVGVHRAALFGGDQPVTLDRILDMLIGRVAGIGFENQIVSVSGKLVLPTESVIPLEAYLEWGAEDAAGAWIDVPGRVMGLWSPALPFWPEAAVGIEYASFATSCCSNPSWYRHWSFPGAWASRDRTLGHRVGGDGTELMAHLAADLLRGHLHVRAEAFRRERRDENLYSPGRTGVSWGAALGGFVSPASNLRIRFDAAVESGADWTQTDIGIQGIVFF